IERIKAEQRGGFQVADILSTAVATLTQAKMEGITEPFGPQPELQKSQDKNVWKISPVVDKEGNILFSTPSLTSPWINTTLVKPGEEPKSWRDLLQPRWKGKISIGDPDSDPTSNYIYYKLARKQGILDDTYFRELGKVGALYPTSRMSATAVAKGEVDISFASTPNAMAFALQAGVPVKAIDMLEGVTGSRSVGVSVLTKAPHPNAARVFVNWWFSREGQNIFHETLGTESVRLDVPNFIPALGQLIPKNVFWISPEEEAEVAGMQRERVLKTLLSSK
ncbi:MAG: extracellular solute-binding protein, partial [Dehalococcoidia bacterium]|nr:extracellular solute-binding protein [Dehalococcoidia bacterium]